MNKTLYEKLVTVGAAVLIAVFLWATLILFFLLETPK